ncbi:MAG: L-histidine N(alpha)-methyltransferase [Myxococcales bacterium]|nr:L-histidine N(alpha)-methyltransferase [Myxococcales bacterium]
MRVSQRNNTAFRARRRSVQLLDLAPAAGDFQSDVIAGLAGGDRTLPCKYLYDDLGSWLFEQICELPEYYLTRTELQITRDHAAEMASACGLGVAFLELGSGSSLKTRIVLQHLRHPVAYVPVDISRVHLLTSSESLAYEFPRLPIFPVCADFTQPFPPLELGAERTVVYFPGSTIGNFIESEAVALLRNLAGYIGPRGGMLVGVDLAKDPAILERAYNDSRGVTAAFNLNLLVRINRELGADFDLDAWRHVAIHNPGESRIEMHLVSRRHQTVRLGGHSFVFRDGETIRSEYSHKYSRDHFAGLAAAAGLRVRQVWTDPQQLFSVQYLTPVDPHLPV